MNYKSKYLKYKIKYIRFKQFLLKQNGGFIINKNINYNPSENNDVYGINKIEYDNEYNKTLINKTIITLYECFV